LIDTRVHDLRDFAHDRHRTVDDRPFGGGEGMVMKPEPIFEAVGSLVGAEGAAGGNEEGGFAPPGTAIVLLSAAGKVFRQEGARRLAKLDRVVLVCGRYEGVDERVAEHLATDEISIGDFVLSGGELAAAMILDAVTRLVPGALGNEDSSVNESFSESGREIDLVQEDRARDARGKGAAGRVIASELRITERGILDFPHYTRPQSFRGWEVPEVLISGNHEEIRRWRAEKALEKTLRNRPDLLERFPR
jgi:tRNA (guanine37-N1)-methyltransferase